MGRARLARRGWPGQARSPRLAWLAPRAGHAGWSCQAWPVPGCPGRLGRPGWQAGWARPAAGGWARPAGLAGDQQDRCKHTFCVVLRGKSCQRRNVSEKGRQVKKFRAGLAGQPSPAQPGQPAAKVAPCLARPGRAGAVQARSGWRGQASQVGPARYARLAQLGRTILPARPSRFHSKQTF